MSFITQSNPDDLMLWPSDVSRGGQVSFLDGLQRAYQTGSAIESQYGAANDLVYQEQEMFQRIRKAGGTPPKSAYEIVEGLPTYSKADEVATALRSGNRRRYDELVGPRDEELRTLKLRYPDANVQTYGEMYNDYRTRTAKLRAQNQKDYTTGGSIGAFIGGAASSFNPNVNPLTVLTAPFGGVGKTAAMRIASQAGVQSGVQAIEEFTGVRHNRWLAGENPTMAETYANIALAGAGGALLQGAGEGLGAIGKRWFKNLPNDPAPPPPKPVSALPAAPVETLQPSAVPRQISISAEVDNRITQAVRETIGGGRATYRTSAADYKHVAQNIEDWTGPAPWEIAPPTASRVFEPPGAPSVEFKAPSPGETIDEIARRIDPDTFRVYDKLAAQKKEGQGIVARLASERNIDIPAKLKTLDDRISELQGKLADANRRKTKIYETELAKVKDERVQAETALLSTDTGLMAMRRQHVMQVDEKMRDLAPAVSRAYARARGKFEAYDEQRVAIEKMMHNGDTVAPPELYGPPKPSVVDKAAAELTKARIVNVAPELINYPVKAGEDAADAVKRSSEAEAKIVEKALEDFRASAPKLVEATGKEAVIDTGMGEIPLSRLIKTVDEITGDSKTMTVRQMLEQMKEDEDVLRIVTTCAV